MTTNQVGTNAPDKIGLAAARAAQQAAGDSTVILFGSRARGDHKPESDVDLLLVYRGEPIAAYCRANQAIRNYFKQNPPWLRVSLLTISRQEFEYCRRAPNHVAAQALRDGIVMSGERFDQSDAYADQYPASWPDVKERIITAQRNIRTMEIIIANLPDDPESYGFHAQQAVENSIKAWISAANLSYRTVHDLVEIAGALFNDPTESNCPAGRQLKLLLDYTSYPNPDDLHQIDNWLTRYAVTYRYSGTGHRMVEIERSQFRSQINQAVTAFIDRAHELTGTTPEDL